MLWQREFRDLPRIPCSAAPPSEQAPSLLSPAKPLPSGLGFQGVQPLLCRQSCSRAVRQLCSPRPSSLCRAQGWEQLPSTGGSGRGHSWLRVTLSPVPGCGQCCQCSQGRSWISLTPISSRRHLEVSLRLISSQGGSSFPGSQPALKKSLCHLKDLQGKAELLSQ